jgi:DNA-binding response OmpR family regulator
MDVSMPIMDGFETCKNILKIYDTNIIFISANDNTTEIMRSYEAGGIDYIIKPFNPAELLTKIEFALESLDKVTPPTPALVQEPVTLDVVRALLDFNRECLNISDLHSLAKLIIHNTENLSLSCCVQLHSNVGIFEASSSGSVTKLESEVLTRILQEEGRIFSNGSRLFITFDNVALLIKNVSETANGDDTMKNTLASLIENANSMLLNLDRIHALKQNNNQHAQASLSDIKSHLEVIQEQLQHQKQFKKDSVKIVDEVLETMESSFVDLGLTYNQEQALLTILHAGIDKSLKHLEQGHSLDEHLDELINDVNTLLTLYK